MLILVAVTITMAVNGGLFNYAARAGQETNDAVRKEQELASGKVTIGNTTYNSIDDYLHPETGTTLLSLYKSGELKVGDYVDYKPNGATAVNPDNPENAENVEAGALTGYTSTDQSVAYEALSWRVLGYDETKNELLLISATPTTANGAIEFYGHVGYNNYEEVLKTTCSKLYSNEELGATARSITMDDIDTYLGGSAYDKTTFNGGSTSAGGYGYRNTSITSRFQYDEDTDTLELVADEGTVTLDLTSKAYYYTASDEITDATKLDLLQGTNAYNPFYYWVASRAVGVNSSVAAWCVDCVIEGDVYAYGHFCYSGGDEFSNPRCVRPIVSLSSKVTTKQVPVLETAPTVIWEDPLGMYE